MFEESVRVEPRKKEAAEKKKKTKKAAARKALIAWEPEKKEIFDGGGKKGKVGKGALAAFGEEGEAFQTKKGRAPQGRGRGRARLARWEKVAQLCDQGKRDPGRRHEKKEENSRRRRE